MPQSILITQCLQNDFVKPIRRYDPLPNLLHVGFEEVRRVRTSRAIESAAQETFVRGFEP